MNVVRLASRARQDVSSILDHSEFYFGGAARRRYDELILASFRMIGLDPMGPMTRDLDSVSKGLRTLHLRHCRSMSAGGHVTNPSHAVFYRMVGRRHVLIVRVLHDRMDIAGLF